MELLVVIGIIALVAGMAAPSFKNLRGGSSVRIATQQLVSDLSLARLKAITERTTVYMVFLDTNVVSSNPTGLTTAQLKQRENLMGGQYTAYNLFVERGVGDQPGSMHPRYLTEWRYLPDGMFIAQSKFANYVALNSPYNRSFRRDRPFPFPDEFGNTLNMPYIAFGPTGELVRDAAVAGAATRSSRWRRAACSTSSTPTAPMPSRPRWSPRCPPATPSTPSTASASTGSPAAPAWSGPNSHERAAPHPHPQRGRLHDGRGRPLHRHHRLRPRRHHRRASHRPAGAEGQPRRQRARAGRHGVAGVPENPPIDTFNGAPYQAADYLTNYVTRVVSINNGVAFTNSPAQINRGWKIIGLLSNPTNQITYADMRAISGTAADRGANQPTAFNYRLFCQVTNAAVFTPEVANSLYEVRLTFRWPVFPNGSVGDGRRTYRTMVSGSLRTQLVASVPDRYYLEPLVRTNAL
ncbi:MAG: hypothetical protein HC841_05410 [Verrucomicrobiae bacterium]|nr:hypothetical protein [Verrucomicrobiae bacterium]